MFTAAAPNLQPAAPPVTVTPPDLPLLAPADRRSAVPHALCGELLTISRLPARLRRGLGEGGPAVERGPPRPVVSIRHRRPRPGVRRTGRLCAGSDWQPAPPGMYRGIHRCGRAGTGTGPGPVPLGSRASGSEARNFSRRV